MNSIIFWKIQRLIIWFICVYLHKIMCNTWNESTPTFKSCRFHKSFQLQLEIDYRLWEVYCQFLLALWHLCDVCLTSNSLIWVWNAHTKVFKVWQIRNMTFKKMSLSSHWKIMSWRCSPTCFNILLTFKRFEFVKHILYIKLNF